MKEHLMLTIMIIGIKLTSSPKKVQILSTPHFFGLKLQKTQLSWEKKLERVFNFFNLNKFELFENTIKGLLCKKVDAAGKLFRNQAKKCNFWSLFDGFGQKNVVCCRWMRFCWSWRCMSSRLTRPVTRSTPTGDSQVHSTFASQPSPP